MVRDGQSTRAAGDSTSFHPVSLVWSRTGSFEAPVLLPELLIHGLEEQRSLPIRGPGTDALEQNTALCSKAKAVHGKG